MSLTAFYYAFAIPVGIIILANAIIFGMILKNLLGRPKGLRRSRRVSSFCYTSGTRRIILVTNPVISHEWVKDWEVLTTSGTYP
jgi:hypothetical protein